ncbi:hypothetical protein HYH02_003805 [Chlamydomonas schloesseri]|uniref:Uncharacterized protein n=1 Tax=Chlamydomonas schloesseri TaxID=2026947 RepID=A0A835WNR0_9CHLO|nr:hypothetical protein HYH02_003805 [Chlamydomonas schloesseri]|eukprot:KAG2451198.1 hypothetical protein HYH02_003805 [Chlamydomonas schloesseri]
MTDHDFATAVVKHLHEEKLLDRVMLAHAGRFISVIAVYANADCSVKDSDGEVCKMIFRCACCNHAIFYDHEIPPIMVGTVKGAGCGFGANAAAIEGAGGRSAKRVKNATNSAGGGGGGGPLISKARVTTLNMQLAPLRSLAELVFNSPNLGWHFCASDTSLFKNLVTHLKTDTHIANMAAWLLRILVSACAFPSYTPTLRKGTYICQYLAPHFPDLQPLPARKGVNIRQLGAAAAPAPLAAPLAAGGGGSGSGDLGDIMDQYEEDMYGGDDGLHGDVAPAPAAVDAATVQPGAPKPTQAAAAVQGAEEYDATTAMWVRCRSCKGQHSIMRCCVGAAGAVCGKYCSINQSEGASVMTVYCKQHISEYMHTVPVRPRS